MKKFLLTHLTILLLSTSFSQTASIIWQKVYGGSGQDYSGEIIETNDNGYLLLGRSNSIDIDITSPIGNYDFWAIKMDSAGNKLWDKNYGNTYFDYGQSVKQTTDGGYIMAGYTYDSLIGGTASINYRIVKTNSIGNQLWNFNYGGTDSDYANDVIQANDGDYVVVGYSQSSDYDFSTNVGQYDAWIMKLYSNGTVRWVRSYGDSLTDKYEKVIQTSNGDFIAVGSATDTSADPGDPPSDYLVSKYGADGTLKWHKTFGGSFNDNAVSVVERSSNSFYVVGTSWSNDRDVTGNYGDGDVWLIEIDSNGNLIWEQNFGADSIELAYDMFMDSDGGLLIAARSVSTANNDISDTNQGFPDWWIFKTNTTGTVLWEESFGGSDWEDPASIIQDQDGGVVIAGRSESFDGDLPLNNGQADVWIMKLQQPTTTSIITNGNDDFEIYPNPSSGIIRINSNEPIENLLIFNIQGEAILSNKVNHKKSLTLSLCDVPNGVYFIKLNNHSIKKLILNR